MLDEINLSEEEKLAIGKIRASHEGFLLRQVIEKALKKADESLRVASIDNFKNLQGQSNAYQNVTSFLEKKTE